MHTILYQTTGFPVVKEMEIQTKGRKTVCFYQFHEYVSVAANTTVYKAVPTADPIDDDNTA